MAGLSGTRIGIVGGTGPQGRGLALRWSRAGLSVVLGSRDAERAASVAADIGPEVSGATNAEAAAQAEVVVIAVPWDAHATTVHQIAPHVQGKVVIDCVNPLGFDERGPYPLGIDEGSAAEQAQAMLTDARVVGAFHHVSAVQLADADCDVACDVMVLGDDRAATELVIALADLIPGVRGIFAGRLRNAHQVEALTANLIAINRRYKAHAGVRVTDV